mmetsp:Transcript_67234/g.186258  ORF Transcript_67234/g.186258 Transcript_67234/m.186258 type:complete len:239 (-) Transcript_67234:192-908(-)
MHRGFVHEGGQVPDLARRLVEQVGDHAQALPEGGIAEIEEFHGRALHLPEVVVDEPLVAVLPPLDVLLLGVLQEALVGLLVGADQHDATAEPVLDILRVGAHPSVLLPPVGLKVENVIQAAGDDGIGVQPNKLVVPRQAPDLELPVGDAPRLHHGLLKTLWKGHHLHRLDLDVQASETLRGVGPVRQLRGVGHQERGVIAQAMQGAAEGQGAPEVLWRCAPLIVCHHHVGVALLLRPL